MTDGYIYCFSNTSMPGILKIGMTERDPNERTKELFTTGIPAPFNIEFAKKVSNPKKKETLLHQILELYAERINPKREFFKVSIEEVKLLFELIEGDNWIYDEREEEEEKNESGRGCRDMSKCFFDGQKIMHTIGDKTWIGIFDKSRNLINYNNSMYTLNSFAMNHYRLEKPERVASGNAWKECKCEIDNEWVSTYNLKILK